MGDVFEKAARAAAAYLAAHAALVAAGVSEERPAAARRLADAWIALTKACAELPAGGLTVTCRLCGATMPTPDGFIVPHGCPGTPREQAKYPTKEE